MKSSELLTERWGGGTVIEDVIEDDELRNALFGVWRRFSRGKLRQKKVQEFWMGLEENLLSLYHDIMHGTYTHQRYEQFVIRDTKPRKISVAAVRDRVVHHYVSYHLASVYARRFSVHSYASQTGKGTTAARKYVFGVIDTMQKNGSDIWIGKMDVRKYFENIEHSVLRELLFSALRDSRMRLLCEEIIRSYGTSGRGLPLGNLTSQYFANIYLHELDQFVLHTLKVKRYMRYNDDMIVLSESENAARQWVAQIQAFVATRLLFEIPRDKISIVRLPTPVDILGVVTDGSRRWLRAATRKRAEKRLRKCFTSLHPHLLDSQCSYASIGVISNYF